MKNRLKYILPIIFSALIAYVVWNAATIWNYGKLDGARPSDVVIVLGAGTADGEVSPVFRERINHGIWLYENGYADTIIMTGGVGEGNEYSDSYAAKMYAMSNNVPEEDILIEDSSTITQENIANAKVIMDEKKYSTAIVVSDPLHMKRAMLMAADYGIEAYNSPTPTTRYIGLKNKIAFLAREVFFYIGYKLYRLI